MACGLLVPLDGNGAHRRAHLDEPGRKTVRKLILWTMAPVAVVALACGKSKPNAPTAMTEDLKRDLQLASATQNLKISADEISPKSHQELAVKPKRAPDGPKVVRTQKPTVKASAVPTEVAEVKNDLPQMQVLASSPTPSETPTSDAPPLARPAAIPVSATYPGAAPIPASNGSGGILGGIFGAVIRGGGVGDDDHCDPRGPVRTGRVIGGDVYGRNPMGAIMGGMGTGRVIAGGRGRR
jgi:hypothetical protein